ncbi:hypothetical protein FNU76_22450 [Chitinimonas arctica]|uniref:Uncharacterized protein n=1 Tax=Chitinimonas arctica TaxID=2594795 RepID=A0A516SL56_9NEIS|nr:hypothetical protein [Chitinimonas arctica]QDQ28890.1 hypothetical protein FNU76_22450 [Chitinimonas arctica]
MQSVPFRQAMHQDFISFDSFNDFMQAAPEELNRITDYFYVDGNEYQVVWHLGIPLRDEQSDEYRYFQAVNEVLRDPARPLADPGPAFLQGKNKLLTVSRYLADERYNDGFDPLKCVCCRDLFGHRMQDGSSLSRAERMTTHMQRHCQPPNVIGGYHMLDFMPVPESNLGPTSFTSPLPCPHAPLLSEHFRCGMDGSMKWPDERCCRLM